jgi:hypothetical protein
MLWGMRFHTFCVAAAAVPLVLVAGARSRVAQPAGRNPEHMIRR